MDLSPPHTPDASLDIRGVACPINFVKTKLALEKLAPGQVLEIFLSGDAAENVPQSVAEEGHTVLLRQQEADHLRLYVQKA